MKLYYKKGWGITMLSLGGCLLLMDLMLMFNGIAIRPQLIISIMLPVMGILYLNKPCFEVKQNELLIYNLFGMVVKTYKYNELSDLSVEADKIYVNVQGTKQKLRLSKLMIRDNDWNAMLLYIATDSNNRSSAINASKELHTLREDL